MIARQYSELSVLDTTQTNESDVKSINLVKGGFWPGFPDTVPSRRKRYDMIFGGDVEGVGGLELRSIYMSDLPDFYRNELALRMTA